MAGEGATAGGADEAASEGHGSNLQMQRATEWNWMARPFWVMDGGDPLTLYPLDVKL